VPLLGDVVIGKNQLRPDIFGGIGGLAKWGLRGGGTVGRHEQCRLRAIGADACGIDLQRFFDCSLCVCESV
jgi:hypothetical protein